MAVRLILFTPREIASILHQHVGIPGQYEMIVSLVTSSITMTTEEEPLQGVSTVFNGVKLVIKETPMPDEEKVRKLVG